MAINYPSYVWWMDTKALDYHRLSRLMIIESLVDGWFIYHQLTKNHAETLIHEMSWAEPALAKNNQSMPVPQNLSWIGVVHGVTQSCWLPNILGVLKNSEKWLKDYFKGLLKGLIWGIALKAWARKNHHSLGWLLVSPLTVPSIETWKKLGIFGHGPCSQVGDWGCPEGMSNAPSPCPTVAYSAPHFC